MWIVDGFKFPFSVPVSQTRLECCGNFSLLMSFSEIAIIFCIVRNNLKTQMITCLQSKLFMEGSTLFCSSLSRLYLLLFLANLANIFRQKDRFEVFYGVIDWFRGPL